MKQYVCLTGLVLLSLFAGGCAENPQKEPMPAAEQAAIAPPVISDESERLYAEGAEAYSRYDYDEAIAAYDAAIAADGSNYKALSGKGIALAMRGSERENKTDIADGIASVRAALSLYPQYVPAYYDLAMAYKIDGQYGEAIAYFQKVVNEDPQNTWSYYGIAAIYGDKGDAGNAAAYLRRAAALDRDNVLQTAQRQSHFDAVRHTPEFQAVMAEYADT